MATKFHVSENKNVEWMEKILNISKIESERGFVIFVHSLLEIALYELLRKFLVAVGSKDKLINETGSFYHKTHLCYRVGLISSNLKTDLLLINDIRNKFAHEFEIDSLNHKIIQPKIEKLINNSINFIKDIQDTALQIIGNFEDNKQFFILAIAWIFGSIYYQIERAEHIKPHYLEFGYEFHE